MRRLAAVFVLSCLAAMPISAQTRAAAKPAASALKLEPAAMHCPSPLGTGVSSKRSFCDVPIGRTPADGITITLPPHKGPITLVFDLHNRQVYSEDLVKAKRSFAETTATIGVLTMDNTLVSRAVVQNEFRTAADLFDRIGGGLLPGGLKAVAPSGIEGIRIVLPDDANEVCILGEKMIVRRFEGTETFTAPGRPIAVISNVMVEYTPQPAKKAPAKAPAKKPAKKAPTRR